LKGSGKYFQMEMNKIQRGDFMEKCKTLQEIINDGDFIEEIPESEWTIKKIPENWKNFRQFRTEKEIISTYTAGKANMILHQPVPGSPEHEYGKKIVCDAMVRFYHDVTVRQGLDCNGINKNP